MSYEDFPRDMSEAERKEIHGIQLRQAADRLETGVDFLDICTDQTIYEAAELLQRVGHAATRRTAS